MVLHSFSASGVAAVTSGRGTSGLALVVGVGGVAMVNSVAVGCGAHYRVSASSASWAAVAACLECISPWVGDASHRHCGMFWQVMGDFGSVSSGLLLGARFLFPTGLHTMSSMSWRSGCTPLNCSDISSMAEELFVKMSGHAGIGCMVKASIFRVISSIVVCRRAFSSCVT
jgi:hypothetical protein